MSPEIYYSLLHTITSIEDYTKVKGLYKGELNIGHIFVLLKKIPEFAKYRIAEWAFVACLRQEFDEWYDILCSISEKEQEKRIKIMLQSERYKQLQVITPKGILTRLSCSGGLSATPSQRLKSNGRQNWIPLSQ